MGRDDDLTRDSLPSKQTADPRYAVDYENGESLPVPTEEIQVFYGMLAENFFRYQDLAAFTEEQCQQVTDTFDSWFARFLKPFHRPNNVTTFFDGLQDADPYTVRFHINNMSPREAEPDLAGEGLKPYPRDSEMFDLLQRGGRDRYEAFVQNYLQDRFDELEEKSTLWPEISIETVLEE